MKLKLLTVMSVLLLMFSYSTFTNAAISAAEKSDKICSLVNDTMILSSACIVDKENQLISLEILLSERRAGMLCGSIKRIAYSNGWNLPTDWTIQINSKDAGIMSVSECAYKPTDLFG